MLRQRTPKAVSQKKAVNLPISGADSAGKKEKVTVFVRYAGMDVRIRRRYGTVPALVLYDLQASERGRRGVDAS